MKHDRNLFCHGYDFSEQVFQFQGGGHACGIGKADAVDSMLQVLFDNLYNPPGVDFAFKYASERTLHTCPYGLMKTFGQADHVFSF